MLKIGELPFSKLWMPLLLGQGEAFSNC